MKIHLCLGALALLPSLGLAQTSDIPRDRLYFAAQDDGSPQVRGRTYKAEFGPDGATYIPYCGPRASTNHPLTLRLQSITAGGERLRFSDSAEAQRDGNCVSYARGLVTEVYALDVDSIEQKFVFAGLPSSGELVLRMACETGMSVSTKGGEIVFASAEGSVRYGAATVLDAGGASTPAQTQLVEGGLEIRVASEFLAQATFPVTIDPVITTFGVSWGGTTFDDFAPAIAWDETNQRYCTVMEEAFSATDHDVIYVFSDPAGAFLWAGYINLGPEYWATPDVANNNMVDQFFVCAAVGLPWANSRTIHGMTLGASTAVLGPNVELSVGDIGDMTSPSVGGDPYLGASYYSIVWQRSDFFPGSDDDIHARLLDTNSVLAGAGHIVIDDTNGSLDRHPRISKSCQDYGIHHIVWERWLPGGYCDVYGAEISWSGAINVNSTPLLTGTVTSAPACSPIDDGYNWVLVCQFGAGVDRDIVGQHLTSMTMNDAFNLSNQEHLLGANNLTRDQTRPAVDTDGSHFAISYSEESPSAPAGYHTFVSTIDLVAGTVRVGELHRALAPSTTQQDFSRMCSQSSAGGSGNRLGIVWSNDVGGASLHDVEAALYETGDFVLLCSPGMDGVLSCPCGNPPSAMGRGCNNSSGTGGASIAATGSASLANETVTLSTAGEKPTASSIVTQGSVFLSGGAGFGQGVRCAAGSLKRLYLKPAVGGSISAPVGADPRIPARSAALGDPLSPGSFRYYFVYYRDPIVLGGCPAASGFNATSTLQILWRL